MPNFFTKNKKLILAVILVGIIATPLALVPTNFAKADLANPSGLFIDTCKLIYPSTWGTCVMRALNGLINEITMQFLGWLVGISGSLLDFFIKFSLDSSYFKDNVAINNGWKLIRDLVNMGFIFILLYIAISTILQSSSYNIRSMLVKLIIAAVFINFSLFATKIVMDAGNIVALNFYNALAVPVQTDGGIVNQPNIGKTFQNYLKIQNKYDPRTGEKIDIDSKSSFLNSTMRAITAAIVIYIFLSLAFVFIARIIAFIFLMIFSPIGFIGSVFPGASGAATKWRKTLIDQTLVAPVFLILIYLVAKTIESGIFEVPLPNLGDPAVAVSLDAKFYFNYIIIIGLLLTTKKITKGLSGEMGVMVEKFGKKAMAIAAGATLAVATGGAAMAGRVAIGRGAAALASSAGLKDMAAKKGMTGIVGRTALRASNRVAESSFDVRANRLFQAGTGKLGLASGASTLGLDLKKKAQYTNFRKGLSEKAEREADLAEKMKLTPEQEKARQEKLDTAKANRETLETKAKTERESKSDSATRMLKEQKTLIDNQIASLNAEKIKIENEKLTADATRISELDRQLVINANKIQQSKKAAENISVEIKQAEDKIKIENPATVEEATKAAEVKNVANKNQLETLEQNKKQATAQISALETARSKATNKTEKNNFDRQIKAARESIVNIDKQITNIKQTTANIIAEEMNKLPQEIRTAQEILEKTQEKLGNKPEEEYLKNLEEKRMLPTVGRWAASGAAAGTLVGGPVGAVVGAAVGSLVGAIRGMTRSDAKEIARKAREEMSNPKRKKKGKKGKLKDALPDEVREQLEEEFAEDSSKKPPAAGPSGAATGSATT